MGHPLLGRERRFVSAFGFVHLERLLVHGARARPHLRLQTLELFARQSRPKVYYELNTKLHLLLKRWACDVLLEKDCRHHISWKLDPD